MIIFIYKIDLEISSAFGLDLGLDNQVILNNRLATDVPLIQHIVHSR